MDTNQIFLICEGYKSGKRLAELSKIYGLHQVTIYKILIANGVKTSKKTISYKEDVFDEIDTELKAYVLGLITSDGYIAHKSGRYVVSLGSTDKEIPETFAKLIEYQSNIYLIKAKPEAKRNKDEWRIMVGSKRLVLALEQLGVINAKSLRETFCDVIPDELIRHYIRGLYDGDGSLGIYSNKKWKEQASVQLCGSKDMLKSVSIELNKHLGIPVKEPFTKDGNLHVLIHKGNNIAKLITGWLYGDCSFALSRKKSIAQQIASIQGRAWKVSIHGRPTKFVVVSCDYCQNQIMRKEQRVRKHNFCDQLCWSKYFNEMRKPKPTLDS